MSNLVEETRNIMKKYGIRANKDLGQNFLINNEVVENIVNSSEISQDDMVIEIGPGLGTLTKYLLEKAGKVLCIELDRKMIEILEDRFEEYSNFEIINDDVLKVDLNKIIKENKENEKIKNVKIVANLPYYITTPIIKKVVDSNLFDTVLIMVQDEVANRFCASVNSKDYGSLTVYLNAYYKVNKLFKVNRKLFNPSPKVDSAVVLLEKKKDVNIKDFNLFNKLVKDSFQFKRKTLKNNLKNYDLNLIEGILNKYNLSIQNRAEDINVDIYIEIANNLEM